MQTFSGAYGGMAPAFRLPLEAAELAQVVSAVVDPTRMTTVLDDVAERFTRSEREGLAPRRSSSRASSRPRPLPAPVTTTTLPCNST